MLLKRYELSSRYLGIQEASSLQDVVLVNNLGKELKDKVDGDLLEVGRVRWEDLPLGPDGDNSGDQTALELVDLPWDKTWEVQTWVPVRG